MRELRQARRRRVRALTAGVGEDGPPVCVQLEPTICPNRTNTFASTSCGLKLSSAFWFKTLERERAHVRDQVTYSAGRRRPGTADQPTPRACLSKWIRIHETGPVEHVLPGSGSEKSSWRVPVAACVVSKDPLMVPPTITALVGTGDVNAPWRSRLPR